MDELLNVFLFTGFLEAGKTTFVQSCLENIGFCSGEPTLLLVCEEGEVEYEPDRFAAGGVTIEQITDPDQINRWHLAALARKHHVTRVLVEYNGMWMLDDFYEALPENWRVVREMLFIDAQTFLTYNDNIRQLMYDKLKRCTVACFNQPDETTDKELIHKIVRGASRKADIAYQYPDGHTEYDMEEDALPYDLDAPVVEIEDYDFAIWSRDITDAPDKYDGKTVHFKVQTVLEDGLGACEIGVGRYVMVCCENDMQFMGLVCENIPAEVKNDESWVNLTGVIHIKNHSIYDGAGPVIDCLSIARCDAPSQPVATFY